MVFKARFFSSKKSETSSPDGSSSSLGSNTKSKDSSPGGRGLLKKKNSSRAKEIPNSTTGISASSSPSSRLKKLEENEVPEPEPQTPVPVSLSPIVASSLGLNKIKTRSGPLPQGIFFSFENREKGAILGSSNLSKPLGGRSGTSGRNGALGDGKDKGKSYGEHPENRSNWDNKSTESKASMDQSSLVFQSQTRLQNADSSSEVAGKFDSSLRGDEDAYTPEIKTSFDCDNPKESESPRFQAILRVTSAPRKRNPGGIKSFSHELNSKGVRPYPFSKPRRLNNLEGVLSMIRMKFDKAKEEVDSDLHMFAADLIGILEKNAETHPDWQETIEDLLVLARSCAMSNAGEFWLQCEGIVQELDDKRQELPMGMLKKLYTRVLFILTRCTRLMHFHKESGLAEDDRAFPPITSARR